MRTGASRRYIPLRATQGTASSAKPCRITTANSEPASVAAAFTPGELARATWPSCFRRRYGCEVVVTHGNPGHRRPLRVKSSSTTSDRLVAMRPRGGARDVDDLPAAGAATTATVLGVQNHASGRRMRPQDFLSASSHRRRGWIKRDSSFSVGSTRRTHKRHHEHDHEPPDLDGLCVIYESRSPVVSRSTCG